MVYDFGLRLRELREKKHLTQDQVGKYLGVSGANVSGYEKNTISPPLDMLRKLALLYGTTSDYLLGLDDRKAIIIDVKNSSNGSKIDQVAELMQAILEAIT